MRKFIVLAAFACAAAPIALAADENVNRANSTEQSRSETAQQSTTDESFGQKLEDASITARVEALFLVNRALNPLRIQTKTHGNVVTLSGTVDDSLEKDLAEEIARGITGVKDVVNQLRIERAASPSAERNEARYRYEDASLRASVRQRLAYQNNLDDSNIQVQVKDGRVTLRGTVDDESQLRLARRIAESTRGVEDVEIDLTVDGADTTRERVNVAERRDDEVRTDVTDNDDRQTVTNNDVTEQISDEWLEKRIETNIMLDQYVSMRGVDVEVTDGVVLITGNVSSDDQQRHLEELARNMRGVKNVQMKTTIAPRDAD